MAQWQWQTGAGVTYLTCDLLERWSHGFFTQASWPQTPGLLTQSLNPQAKVYRVKQVHGNRVLDTAEMEPVATAELSRVPELSPESTPPGDIIPGQIGGQGGNGAIAPDGLLYDEADGIFATAPLQAVWACSADCTPALLGDVRTGQVAAVHAGWRGTAAQILPEAVRLFVAQGSAIADLRVALGPAIDGSVYQVDKVTAAKTGGMLVDGVDEDAILQRLMAMSPPPVLPDGNVGKVRLDVRRVNGFQLEQLGLLPEQYSIAPHCTFQEPEQFFSYRRTGEKKVQWSGIVSR
jgi:polyphenol oxidase